MSERRQHMRRRTCLGGRIEFKGSYSSINCLVRNAGDRGAKLALSQSLSLPHEFVLHLVERRLRLDARLKWRDADECGVEFVSPPQNVVSLPHSASDRIF
jgi:hypothetical protein